MDWTSLAPKRYRDIFFATHGFGPYPCYFCGNDVSFETVVVHHLDHVRSNNAPENLAPAHGPCHTSHHTSGRPTSALQRERVGDAHRGVPKSAHQREKISTGQTKAHADGRASTWSTSFNQKRQTCVCGLESNVAGIRRHLSGKKGSACR